jgi:hypothetical protein
MRKLTVFFLACAIALVAIPSASSQMRLDIGVMVPRGAGITIGGATSTTLGSDVGNWPFIPIPEAGLYYQGDLGFLKLGIGARAFSFILESIVWPNAYAELDLGRVAIEAQVGGGAFLMFGLVNPDPTFGNVVIPDLSAWLKLGKKGVFRLGGGVIGLWVPETFGDTMPFLIYFGGKAAIML